MTARTPLAYKKETALNAICPYFTMFPLEYPLNILRRRKRTNGLIVLDPFCGRGTTLYAARWLGLRAWGIDSSPIAVAIAKAKLASCDVESPVALAEDMLRTFKPREVPKSSFFQLAYHEETLREICVLRESLADLKTDSDESAVLRAAVLGCLHGPLAKKAENAGYFSNQMPRTYASKPNYAVKFWEKRNLCPPRVSVLQVLRRKIKRLVGLTYDSGNSINQVLYGDAQSPATFTGISNIPSLVITSPPYYGMRTYVQDQWLRNWFLGGPAEVDYSPIPMLSQHSQADFAKSLGLVWKNLAEHGSPDLRMFVRFGTIPSHPVDARQIFKRSLKESGVNWRLVSVRAAASANEGRRQANQMKTSSDASLEFDFHVERVG